MKNFKQFIKTDINKKSYLTEAELTGNLGLPGEDGQGDRFLDKIKREKDAKYRGTNPMSLGRELMEIQRYLGGLTSGKEEQLEKLAEELMSDLYGNVLPENLEFDINLVRSGKEVKDFLDEMTQKSKKPKKQKDEKEEEEEDEEGEDNGTNNSPQSSEEYKKKIKLEIDRRKITNLIIQGEALNVKSVIEMPECLDGLKDIFGEEVASEYLRKMIRLTEIGKQLDWFIPTEHKSQMMEQHPEGFAGACHVDWDGEEDEEGEEEGSEQGGETNQEEQEFVPTLRVVGVDFVMLIHESVKAVYEYLSTPGISKDPEIAQIVKQQTSSFADEADEFKYGPEVAVELRDFINKNTKVDRYPNTREFVYGKLMEMETEPFLLLIKGILSATPSARKEIDEIIDIFISEMEQYERDMMEWEMSQKSQQETEQEDGESEIDKLIRMASSGQEEPESEVLDYSKMSNRELENLIDDALDRQDFKQVEILRNFLKESRYISILEKHIDKKIK